MPWHVAKSAECSPSKPWGVIKDADGSLVACHATEASAKKQVAALYANEPGYERSENASSLETNYRSFAPDLQIRSGANEDGRTVYGIAVPYNAPTRINDRLVESFARSAFNHQISYPRSVKFAREHVALGGERIGAATLLRDDAAGLYVELRAAHTEKGEETLELVREGALDHLSVAFRARQDRRLADGVIERLKADLFEVAVVMEGAYGDLALAAGVRSKEIPQAAMDMDLRAAADEYLHGLPKPTDNDLEIRRIRLGLPYG